APGSNDTGEQGRKCFVVRRDARAKHGFKSALGSAPTAVDGKAHGNTIRREPDVQAAGMAPVMPAVINIEIVIRFIRGLVFAEANIAVDAGKVAVRLALYFKVRVELQKCRGEHCQQAAKGPY